MAMLDRYKKTGGFLQLLNLLETSGPQKQERFLEIIRQEDPRWADALSAKIIDLNRILTWTDSAISEVTGSMLDINIATILSWVTAEQRERLLNTLGNIKKRKVLDLYEGSNKPSAADVATSFNKMYETVRRLAHEGTLRFEKIDPLLHIDNDIEDRLKQGKTIIGVPEFSESFGAKQVASSTPAVTPAIPPALQVVTSLDAKAWANADHKASSEIEAELAGLRKRVSSLQAENGTLRQELTVAQGKLEQIKKIA
jgi:hypothetical protein